MYRNRFYIWGIIFALFLLITSISNLDMSSIIKTTTTVTADIDTDTSFKASFANAKTSFLEIKNENTDASIIIKNNSNDDISGYEKIEKAIYSPIIAFIPTDVDYPTNISYTLSSNASYINLNEVIDAVLNDKTIKDLGITSYYYNEDAKVVLNIPSKGTCYYNNVINQIYICLNNNKVPSAEEKENLKPTVDAILQKTRECNDAAQKIENEKTSFEKGLPELNIIIAPEFYAKSSVIDTSVGYGYYRPTYFEKSEIIAYDIFYKNTKEISDMKTLIYDNILNNETFISSMNYRTSANLKYSNILDSLVCDNINITD